MSKYKFFINNYGGMHGEDQASPLGRIAFLYLDKPNTKFDPPKYGLTHLYDKNNEEVKKTLKAIKNHCLEMASEFCKYLYEKDKPKVSLDEFSKSIIAGFAGQPIFRDGDLAKYEGFPGNYYIVAKNDALKNITFIGDTANTEYEGGQICRIQIQPYLDKKGFSYKLRGIKLVKDDGVRFKKAPPGDSKIKDMDIDSAVEEASMNGSLGESLAKASSGNPLDDL